MENPFFTIISESHEKTMAIYHQRIKWNIRAFAEKGFVDGYIVQKVTINSSEDFGIRFGEPYYEAWRVKDGEIECYDNPDYDDEFLGYDDMFISSCKENCKEKSGVITYNCEVFWVDKADKEYISVSRWKKNVPQANALPSIYVKDCDYTFSNRVTTREFEHEVINEKSNNHK